jgi:tRNA modification GTPase
MNAGDTIAAISSAVGPAARMIVRASGRQACEIARTLTPSPCTQGEGRGEGSVRRTNIQFNDLKIPAWIYLFIAPRSYTGEDLVEFHIPGNPLLAKLLLAELVRLGARLADPGEFTARAYFNGRIDLAEAEGVAAVISAHGERALTAARQLMAGELARRLRPILDNLAETLALLEAGIDFSEEDIAFLTQSQISQRIASASTELERLLGESARFESLSHEPRIVLVGRPNAGKSTLLNALSGTDRAVVSSEPGTTRDAIWAPVSLKRGMARMIDVAGLDDAGQDDISRQMQQRAKQAIEQADLVVLIRDGTDDRPPVHLDRPPDLRVQSKADLKSEFSNEWLPVSARTGLNLEMLKDRLGALAFGTESSGVSFALNARHVRAIEQAREALARAGQATAPEILALELRESLDALGSILGSVTPDDVLGRIFATFCVGK